MLNDAKNTKYLKFVKGSDYICIPDQVEGFYVIKIKGNTDWSLNDENTLLRLLVFKDSNWVNVNNIDITRDQSFAFLAA